MTTNKKIALITALIIIILVVLGITKGPSKSGEAPEEPVKIGVITPLTGFLADFGEEIKNGVLAAPAISGVEFVFQDDACDPKMTVSAYKKLVEFDKIQFLIGPACGSPQEAVIPLLKEGDVLTVVPAAASRTLFDQSDKKFFNIQYALEDESKFIAEKLTELGYEKVALVSFKNAFSETHTQSFRDNFKGTIAVDAVLQDEKIDPSSEILKIKAAEVDAVYSPDISFFFAGGLSKLRDLQVTAPVFATYVAEVPAARTLVPDVYYSFPGDLSGTEGALFNLSREAAELLGETVSDCKGEYDCVHRKLISSNLFDSTGTSKRSLVLKKIKDGATVIVSE